MSIYVLITIAVSLSMDAFSLSLAYGTLNLKKEYIRKISLIVGIFHFFMPLIGMLVGNIIAKSILISPNLIVCIVLTFIGIEMILDSFKEEDDIRIMTNKEIFLFALAVSLDSFSVGIGLKALTDNYITTLLIFSLTSMLFTYIGLSLGKRINKLIGRLSTILGGITLIIIGIIYVI